MRAFARNLITLAACTALAITTLAGCGGGSGGNTPSGTAVSVNSLDGSTNVAVGSTFKYTFTQMISAGTVNNGSFFIVPAPAPAANVIKAAFDSSVCDSSKGVAASVACTSATECELDPTADLQGGTRYAACLSQDIRYSLGQGFEGFMATFTTAGGKATVTAKLVRLDGTELNLTDKPIPRVVKVKYTPSVAITAAADQQAFEAAVKLKDGTGTEVAGAYTWAADGTSALFTPSARLKYKTTYTIEVTDDSMPNAIVIKAGTTSTATFTTLTRHDINGDGFADLIVGAYTNRNTNPPGKLYIFYGTATGIPTCDLSAGCTAGAVLNGGTDDILGLSNKIVGDVNGDGYEDFIVGAPQGSGTYRGTAYVFAGGTTLTGTLAKTQALATISMAAGNSDLGQSVAGAGDMNGDGYDDVVIGAPLANGTTGQAFVFLGGPSLAGALDVANASQAITGQAADTMAAMVSGAGDVNADGFDDIILSTGHGRAYVLYGAATLAAARNAVDADAVLSGTLPFGESVAGAGDVNGDGKADVMVGEPVNAANGKVYVFLGAQLAGAVNAASASTIISQAGGTADDRFGQTLTSAGDVDGDGKPDLLIGGQTASPAADWGLAYIFLAKNLLATLTNAQADTLIHGATGADLLSYGLSGGIDLNGDGFDDIVVGAPQYWTPGTGFAYVFNGSASGITSCTFAAPPTCSPAATITGAAQDALGFMGTTWFTYP